MRSFYFIKILSGNYSIIINGINEKLLLGRTKVFSWWAIENINLCPFAEICKLVACLSPWFDMLYFSKLLKLSQKASWAVVLIMYILKFAIMLIFLYRIVSYFCIRASSDFRAFLVTCLKTISQLQTIIKQSNLSWLSNLKKLFKLPGKCDILILKQGCFDLLTYSVFQNKLRTGSEVLEINSLI